MRSARNNLSRSKTLIRKSLEASWITKTAIWAVAVRCAHNLGVARWPANGERAISSYRICQVAIEPSTRSPVGGADRSRIRADEMHAPVDAGQRWGSRPHQP